MERKRERERESEREREREKREQNRGQPRSRFLVGVDGAEEPDEPRPLPDSGEGEEGGGEVREGGLGLTMGLGTTGFRDERVQVWRGSRARGQSTLYICTYTRVMHAS